MTGSQIEVGQTLYRVTFTETDQGSVSADLVSAQVLEISEHGLLVLDDERWGRSVSPSGAGWSRTAAEAIRQARGAAHQRRHAAVRELDAADSQITALADLLVSRMEATR